MKLLELKKASNLGRVSFCETYCRRRQLDPDKFSPQVFWHCMYPHARLFALMLGRRADYFSVDRTLIDYCGALASLDLIDAEIAQYSRMANHGFLRHRCRFRVSGRRLKTLANSCLAAPAQN